MMTPMRSFQGRETRKGCELVPLRLPYIVFSSPSGRWDTSRIGVLTSRVLETSYHGDKDPTRPLKRGLRSEVITVSVRRPRDDGTHLCGRVPPIAQEEHESPRSPASDRSLGAVVGQSFPIPLVIIRRVIYSTNPAKDSVRSNANA